MSSEPTLSSTPSRDRTEAAEWYALGAGAVVVALLVGAAGSSSADEGGSVVGWLVAAGLVLLVALVCLVVGAVITGTTIALRAEHARVQRERPAPRAD